MVQWWQLNCRVSVICSRMCFFVFVFPPWFERESIPGGHICSFYPGGISKWRFVFLFGELSTWTLKLPIKKGAGAEFRKWQVCTSSLARGFAMNQATPKSFRAEGSEGSASERTKDEGAEGHRLLVHRCPLTEAEANEAAGGKESPQLFSGSNSFSNFLLVAAPLKWSKPKKELVPILFVSRVTGPIESPVQRSSGPAGVGEAAGWNF